MYDASQIRSVFIPDTSSGLSPTDSDKEAAGCENKGTGQDYSTLGKRWGGRDDDDIGPWRPGVLGIWATLGVLALRLLGRIYGTLLRVLARRRAAEALRRRGRRTLQALRWRQRAALRTAVRKRRRAEQAFGKRRGGAVLADHRVEASGSKDHPEGNQDDQDQASGDKDRQEGSLDGQGQASDGGDHQEDIQDDRGQASGGKDRREDSQDDQGQDSGDKDHPEGTQDASRDHEVGGKGRREDSSDAQDRASDGRDHPEDTQDANQGHGGKGRPEGSRDAIRDHEAAIQGVPGGSEDNTERGPRSGTQRDPGEWSR